MAAPIFFDATGKRRRYVGRLLFAVIALILAGAAVFAASVVNVPSGTPLSFGSEREQPLPFLARVARLRHGLPKLHFRESAPRELRVGFYVPWDESSLASLQRHIGQLDWVVADEGHIDSAHGKVDINPDPAFTRLIRTSLDHPARLLMVQNFANEQWDSSGTARLLADRGLSDAMISDLLASARTGGWNGVVFDIENLPETAQASYLAMLERAHPLFRKNNLVVAVTAAAGQPPALLGRFGKATDYLFLMDYDQHWQGGEAGPIADNAWFGQQLAQARAQVPAGKLIVALGSYGYDWHDGKADALTMPEAWLSARDSGAQPQFDPASGNSGFAFDDDGHRHIVWFLDAAASWNQMGQLGKVAGFALWRLGSEDPGFWEDVAAMREGRLPRLGVIPPTEGTDVTGNGEILRIAAKPNGGARDLRFDRQAIIGENYRALPSPYQIQRTGAQDPKAIALTFDDGPDPDFTPRILDVLESKNAPAAFFVIGENGLEHPDILRRIAADGDEIGNHSYTHPNLAQVSPTGVKLELNATQRLIEAYTGRSTRLFRAPYFGDAEPTTLDELGPAQIAQDRGYTIVGLHVDPGDWKRPGTQAIVDSTLAQIRSAGADRSANIVLLHDGGGDREQTVAALPLLIDRLRAEGYRIVPVSQLAGLTPLQVMPPVGGADRAAVGADVGIFLALAAIGYAIRWLFFFAIALGIARAVLMTLLAWLDRNAAPPKDDGGYRPSVSVIIPAYNEERVIVASVTRVLQSDYPGMQVIVADDGSKDATSKLVRQHFDGDSRVTLMTLANGGKASALNRALKQAQGEIIIALDADTQFLPDTISKLVRWFANEQIGAVAGNAKVGNRINLVTRWQAIEYVTAQNVERRALDALRAITVVPGAVGAWRRSALDDVGGYPEDTLAEDQDLTIAIQRLGWHVAYDVEAVALTEAPETFRALAKQRYRWSFGTLQCLWKHRQVLRQGRPRGLARFGMPQAWLFQILFAAISPMIDLALLISMIGTALRIHQHGWDQTQSDVLRMAAYWIAFVTIDLFAGWIAYRLEPNRERFPGLLMLAQRFAYRQLMYSVVIRSISAALRGKVVGWGKLERTGSVAVNAA